MSSVFAAADYKEAYSTLEGISAKWSEENPQSYEELKTSWVHSKQQRHIFGIIGGNEVAAAPSHIAADIESDLRGITRPNTFAQWRSYAPPVFNQKNIQRDNTKGAFNVSLPTQQLPEYQMWSYPVVPTPVPLVKEVNGSPHKY